MKVFILNFNRLKPLTEMLEFLNKIDDIEPVIVDNSSNYPPLLEWYKTCQHEIIFKKNENPANTLWKIQKLSSQFKEKYFAFTDVDLDLSNCPLDLFDVLVKGLKKYPNIGKSGVSLEINDLPDWCIHKQEILKQENGFWKNKLDDQFYKADIDTTLAVYRSGPRHDSHLSAIRSDRPYTAKHIDWYSCIENLSDEEKYYLKNITRNTHWSSKKRKSLLDTVTFL